MKPNESWPAITLFGAMSTSIFESEREVLQGTAISLGATTTTVALTDDEIDLRIKNGIDYLESMSYEEIIDLNERLKELELKLSVSEDQNYEKEKIYIKL